MPSIQAPGGNAFDILLRFVTDDKTLNSTKKSINEVTDALLALPGGYSAIGRAAQDLETSLAKQNSAAGRLQVTWWRAQRELKAAQFIFTQMAAVGTAMTAPIIKAATDYIKQMQKAGVVGNEVVDRWTSATDKLKAAYTTAGGAAAKVLLPTLEKIADLAVAASKYAEAHPDIIKAALNTGVVLIALAGIGTLVTQGIKLVVDIKFVTASVNNLIAGEMQMMASKNNLKAAIMNLGAGMDVDKALAGLASKATGGILGGILSGGLISSIASVAIPIIVAAVIAYLAYKGAMAGANALGKKIYGEETWGEDKGPKYAWETFRKEMASLFILPTAAARRLGLVSDESAAKVWALDKKIWGLGPASAAAGDSIDDMTKAAERAAAELKANAILSELAADMAKEQASYEQERQQIITSGQQRLAQATASYASAMTSAASQFASAMAKLESDIVAANEKYEQDKQKIIQDTANQIAEVQEDLQERLRQLAQEHADRVEELTNARDALGLAQENRDYARAIDEEKRQAQERIEEIREQGQRELQELEQQHQRELEEFEQQKIDAQAAYAEQTAAAASQYAAEYAAAQAQTEAELKALDEKHKETQRQLVAEAEAEIRMLGDNLEAERRLKQEYYGLFIGDTKTYVDAMLAEYDRLKAAADAAEAEAGTSGKAGGGYVGKGTYRVGERGYEFVASHSTTRALEAAVQGRLTQSSLLGLMARGSGQPITINDHRTFDSRISVEDRRQIMNDTRQLIMEAFA